MTDHSFSGFVAATHSTPADRLRAVLRRIVDHYDMRSEIYTNDADLAANMAEIARQGLESK
jgi:hypothetical protein